MKLLRVVAVGCMCVLVLGLSACSILLMPDDKFMKELAKDNNTFCLVANVVYGIGTGVMKMYRTGERDVNVKCDGESMSVTKVPPTNPPPAPVQK